MMGTFDNDRMVGYFFLRFFQIKMLRGQINRQRIIGERHWNIMNNIMYETAWRIGFRCLSTISRNNGAVMHAHSKNPTMIVLKELPDNYLLVEFVRKKIV